MSKDKRKEAKLERQMAKYSAKKLRQKNIRFRILYIVLALALGLGGYLVCDYMHDSMLKYEAAQAHALRAVLAEYGDMFVSRDYEAWFAHEDSSQFTLETARDYAEYADSLLKDKQIEYYQVRSDDAGLRKYQVTADERAFAEFALTKTGESADCGIFKSVEYWALAPDTMRLYLAAPQTYTAEIPETAQLYVNGARVGAEYITQSGITDNSAEYLPPDALANKRCVYTLTWALHAPEITAKAENGALIALNNTSPGAYEAQTVYADEELRPLHEEFAVNAVKTISQYLYYTNNKNTLNRVLAYMEPDSKAEEAIRGIDYVFGQQKVDELNFENVATRNYTRYGNNAFSCVISLDCVIQKGRETSTQPTIYTMFFHKLDDEWKLYSYAMYDLTAE